MWIKSAITVEATTVARPEMLNARTTPTMYSMTTPGSGRIHDDLAEDAPAHAVRVSVTVVTKLP